MSEQDPSLLPMPSGIEVRNFTLDTLPENYKPQPGDVFPGLNPSGLNAVEILAASSFHGFLLAGSMEPLFLLQPIAKAIKPKKFNGRVVEGAAAFIPPGERDGINSLSVVYAASLEFASGGRTGGVTLKAKYSPMRYPTGDVGRRLDPHQLSPGTKQAIDYLRESSIVQARLITLEGLARTLSGGLPGQGHQMPRPPQQTH